MTFLSRRRLRAVRVALLLESLDPVISRIDRDHPEQSLRSLFNGAVQIRRDRARQSSGAIGSGDSPFLIRRQFSRSSARCRSRHSHRRGNRFGGNGSAEAVAVDFDRDRFATRARMKIRARVIAIEHCDDDAIKATDLRPICTTRGAGDGINIVFSRLRAVRRENTLMQCFGRPVDTVGPFDRLRAQPNAREQRDIAQRFSAGPIRWSDRSMVPATSSSNAIHSV